MGPGMHGKSMLLLMVLILLSLVYHRLSADRLVSVAMHRDDQAPKKSKVSDQQVLELERIKREKESQFGLVPTKPKHRLIGMRGSLYAIRRVTVWIIVDLVRRAGAGQASARGRRGRPSLDTVSARDTQGG